MRPVEPGKLAQVSRKSKGGSPAQHRCLRDGAEGYRVLSLI